MYYYTYKIISLISEKPYYYYGCHSTSYLNDGYMGSGNRIFRMIKKYGKENFKKEILQFFETHEECLQAEVELIGDLYKTDKWCLNMCSGGQGGQTYVWTEEQKLNQSKNKKGELNPNYGKKHSEKTRQKMSLVAKNRLEKTGPLFLGRKHSKETRQKISQKAKERFKLDKSPMYGKSHTEETKQLISSIVLSQEYYICDYCKIKVNKGNFRRWHGENCKQKYNG